MAKILRTPVGHGTRLPTKPMRDALNVAVNRYVKGEKDKKYLMKIAEELVQKAADGDVVAIKEVFDRMDGKAIQGIAAENPDGTPAKMGLAVVFVPSENS